MLHCFFNICHNLCTQIPRAYYFFTLIMPLAYMNYINYDIKVRFVAGDNYYCGTIDQK